MKELTINNSHVLKVKVDDEDCERLLTYTWTLSGDINSFHIYCTKGNGHNKVTLSIANVVMQKFGVIFDHKDNDPLNNQKSNLREATETQNTYNKQKLPQLNSRVGKVSGYKGVSYKRRGMWRARIKKNGKQIHLGHFRDEVEAAKAYDAKAKELFSEFAYLNFP